MSKLLEQINKTKEYILGDICLSSGGGTPSTAIQEYWNGDIPWLTPTEISNADFCFVSDTKRKITQKGLESSSAKLMPEYSILMSSRANIGDVVINTVPMTTNQGFINMIPNKDLIDLYYFSYWLRTRKNYFIQVSTGSTFLELSKSTFRDISIDLPDLPTQKQIASILSAYDEKIENNNKIIKNLETMAQNIFNEWFVNFRFPGYEKVKFVDSEMGEIPEGWKVLKLGNIFNIKYGKNLPTSKISRCGKFPVYGAGGIIGFYEEKNVDEKVILVTCRGNGSGTIWRTSGEGFVTNNSFTILPNKEFAYVNFISTYFLLKNSNISSALSGSAQPQITIDGLSPIQTIFPSQELLERFQKLITVLLDLVDELLKENDSLKSQRNQLLIKLI